MGLVKPQRPAGRDSTTPWRAGSETVPFDFLVLLKRTIRIIRAAWGDLDAPVLLRQLVVFTTFQTLVRAHGEPWESRPHGTLKKRAGGKNRQSFGETRLPMRTFAQKPKAPQQAIPTKPTILDRTDFGHSHEVNSLLRLQRTIGNQAVQRLVQANAEELSPGSATTTSTRFTQDFSRVPIPPPATVAIQTKLMVNTPGDLYEQEAERIADQVMAAPAQHAVSGVPPHIQRFSKQSNQQMDAASASVDQVLTMPGRPLKSVIRQDMEQRFGYDFSRARVHTGAAAEQSEWGLNARAYTVGHNIVFGTGQFALGTREGQQLIAHELTHVVQQSTSQQAGQVIHRAPVLSGRKTTEHVDDRIAGDIDKALAESPTIAKFIGAKSLKKTKGHLSVDVKEVFESLYQDYAKTHKGMPDVKDVPGFTDREKGNIELRLNVADVEAALHEAIHLNSSKLFQNTFGHDWNEGVTEYFTEKVLAEQKLSGGRAYRDQLKIAESLIAVFDEDHVGKGYFQGDLSMYKQVVAALSKMGEFSSWHDHINSDKPADWGKATEQLKRAFGK